MNMQNNEKKKNGNNLRNCFKNLIPTDYNGNKAA